MSNDQQLAVTRTTKGGESTHLSKAARQVVPPFLQKLYEIVNDPRNDELIRWSDNGDSFFVLNHERFAREVLGRWFKHQKFTSFVRQLNMYGFHKIPHLQQGVLRSDSDSEPWHFEHPHFHRGQPDLLCLIQRRKQPPHGLPEDSIQMEIHEPAHVAAPPLANLTSGQVLDINSVVNGISAIKRHQQAISADLNELKTSNQQLWQEALAARERHKKHQDTINRILKFLAGVFGHNADTGQHKADGTSSSPPRVVIPRKRQRLMIQDVDKEKDASMQEVDDDDDSASQTNGSETPFPTARVNFASLNTPEMSIRSPSLGPSEAAFSPAVSEVPSTYFADIQSIRPAETLSRSTTVEPPKTPSSSYAPSSHPPSSSAVSPSETSMQSLTTNQAQTDQNMWSMVQHMLSSPTSMQKLMQALASQQAYPMANLPDPPAGAPSTNGASQPAASSAPPISQQVMMYDPNTYDPSRFHSSLPPDLSAPILPVLGSPLHNQSDEDSTVAALDPLLHNAERLQKSYEDAADIDADVDALQLSINSLIEGLGLDPNAIAADQPPANDHIGPSISASGGPSLAAPSLQPGPSNLSISNNPSSSSIPHGAVHSSSTSALDSMPISSDPAVDFDFDNFFNELSASAASARNNNLSYPDGTFPDSVPSMSGLDDSHPAEELTAFLDDVSSDTAASPLMEDISPTTATGAAASGTPKGKKRKSDVVELPTPLISGPDMSPPKVKRKR